MSTLEPPQAETPAAEKPALSIEEVSDLHLLDASTLSFRREGIRLQLRREGEEEWQEVTLARLFPLSEPEGWIALLDKDGKETGILRDLHGLTREQVTLLRDELYQRYLVPQIRRIIVCRDKFNLTEWTVDTDRGEMTFLMRHPQENMQTPLPGRVSLVDVDGNRYDIPDLASLDAVSRQWVEQRL